MVDNFIFTRFLNENMVLTVCAKCVKNALKWLNKALILLKIARFLQLECC